MMKFLLNFKLLALFFVIFFYVFFYNDILFFLNPELIVNLIFLVIIFAGFIFYFQFNQKDLLYQRNETRKKNIIFFQTLITNWRRIQLRNKQVRKIFLLKYLYDLFVAIDEEVSYQKAFLENDIKKFLIHYIYVRMKFIEKDLNSNDLIQKSIKGLLLNFWFLNEHEKWISK